MYLETHPDWIIHNATRRHQLSLRTQPFPVFNSPAPSPLVIPNILSTGIRGLGVRPGQYVLYIRRSRDLAPVPTFAAACCSWPRDGMPGLGPSLNEETTGGRI